MGMLQRDVIWATTVKYTQLKKDYEARIVRQESFEISWGRGGGTPYDGLYGEARPNSGFKCMKG